jgi:hypothetical protein
MIPHHTVDNNSFTMEHRLAAYEILSQPTKHPHKIQKQINHLIVSPTNFPFNSNRETEALTFAQSVPCFTLTKHHGELWHPLNFPKSPKSLSPPPANTPTQP